MEFKGTPGPWHFVPENAGLMLDHGYGILFGDPDIFGWEKNLFVSVGCSGNAVAALGEGVPEANARAIAAVPDMVKALETFVAQWNACGPNSDFGRYFQNVRDEAVAALLQAKGADNE